MGKAPSVVSMQALKMSEGSVRDLQPELKTFAQAMASTESKHRQAILEVEITGLSRAKCRTK